MVPKKKRKPSCRSSSNSQPQPPSSIVQPPQIRRYPSYNQSQASRCTTLPRPPLQPPNRPSILAPRLVVLAAVFPAVCACHLRDPPIFSWPLSPHLSLLVDLPTSSHTHKTLFRQPHSCFPLLTHLPHTKPPNSNILHCAPHRDCLRT